jgi:ribosomal protein S18 acetylase RimI-like enzyme
MVIADTDVALFIKDQRGETFYDTNLESWISPEEVRLAATREIMRTMAPTEPASDRRDDSVLVRPATPDDLSEILRLYRQLTDEDTPVLLPDSDKASSVLDAMAAQSGRQLLVAENGRQILGTADLLIVPNLTHGGAPWAVIENVVVDEKARRRGVGRALVADLVRRCTEAHCYKMQLLSNKRRTEAHDFYRSVGFEAMAEGFRRYLL